MNKKLIILILILMLILIPLNIARASGRISLNTDLQEIQKDETFNLNISIDNVSTAAMTLYIYFNTDILEYVSGPENSNYSNSRVIYTWYSQTGTEQQSENLNEINFKFRAKEEGITTFSVFGEIYDLNGNKIDVDFRGTQVEIYTKSNMENNISDSSSYLSQMRLNKEGINPVFDKNITNYYFITEEKINNLEITAIAENPEAKVIINGNTNLKKGLNVIDIEVISKDNKNKTKYTINATISDNLENDNANLENLAIENYYLTPDFDENNTNYLVSVDNQANNLNILAIPENINAKVEIKGNENLKIGNNQIEILVKSKNGKTTKTYLINVYKRNEEEEINLQEEKKEQTEKLSAIIKDANIDENKEEKSEFKKNNINPIIIVVLGIISIILIIIIYKKLKRNKI